MTENEVQHFGPVSVIVPKTGTVSVSTGSTSQTLTGSQYKPAVVGGGATNVVPMQTSPTTAPFTAPKPTFSNTPTRPTSTYDIFIIPNTPIVPPSPLPTSHVPYSLLPGGSNQMNVGDLASTPQGLWYLQKPGSYQRFDTLTQAEAYRDLQDGNYGTGVMTNQDYQNNYGWNPTGQTDVAFGPTTASQGSQQWYDGQDGPSASIGYYHENPVTFNYYPQPQMQQPMWFGESPTESTYLYDSVYQMYPYPNIYKYRRTYRYRRRY